jgi:transposase
MPKPLPLREDYCADDVRRLAKRCRNAKQSRRLLSIAAVYDGMDRGSAAKIGGMDRQILRDWVVRFNELGPDGLIDAYGGGPVCRLNEAQLQQLAAIVEAGPDPDVDGLVRWRCCDLADWIEKQFGVRYHDRTISKLLKSLGFSRISGRPKHPAQDAAVINAFKKTSPPHWQRM